MALSINKNGIKNLFLVGRWCFCFLSFDNLQWNDMNNNKNRNNLEDDSI